MVEEYEEGFALLRELLCVVEGDLPHQRDAVLAGPTYKQKQNLSFRGLQYKYSIFQTEIERFFVL